MRGKQHGLGIYSVPGDDVKHGIWEEGKRIEWFNEETIEMINNQQIDITQYFKNPSEIPSNLGKYGTFHKPQSFDSEIKEVKIALNNLVNSRGNCSTRSN
jgi:hypothetical protein